jgi:hypothetical protein
MVSSTVSLTHFFDYEKRKKRNILGAYASVLTSAFASTYKNERSRQPRFTAQKIRSKA